MFIFQQLLYDSAAVERVKKAAKENRPEDIEASIKLLEKMEPSAWASNRKRLYENALELMEMGQEITEKRLLAMVPSRPEKNGTAAGGRKKNALQKEKSALNSQLSAPEMGEAGAEKAGAGKASDLKPPMESVINNPTIYFEAKGGYVGVKWDDGRKAERSEAMLKYYGNALQDAENPWKMKKARGVVIHATEGHFAGSALDQLEKGKLLTHALLDTDGKAYQTAPFNAAGAHAAGAPYTFGIELVGCTRQLELQVAHYRKPREMAEKTIEGIKTKIPSAQEAYEKKLAEFEREKNGLGTEEKKALWDAVSRAKEKVDNLNWDIYALNHMDDFEKQLKSAVRLALYLQQEYPSARGHVGGHYEVNSDTPFCRHVRSSQAKSTHSDPGQGYMELFKAEVEAQKKALGIKW